MVQPCPKILADGLTPEITSHTAAENAFPPETTVKTDSESEIPSVFERSNQVCRTKNIDISAREVHIPLEAQTCLPSFRGPRESVGFRAFRGQF